MVFRNIRKKSHNYTKNFKISGKKHKFSSGSYHGVELSPLFGVPFPYPAEQPLSETDAAFRDLMLNIVLNFAKTG